MVIEALAAGCIVAAYEGGPISEIVPEQYCFKHGDLVSLVKFVEQVMTSGHKREWAGFHELSTIECHRQISQKFSLSSYREQVLKAWTALNKLQ